MRLLALSVLRFYQTVLSPYLPGVCRYTPTCSVYTYQAISKYGVRGVWIGVRRLIRCHPMRASGYDPVP